MKAPFYTLSKKEEEFLEVLDRFSKRYEAHQGIEKNLAIEIIVLARGFASPEIVVGFFVSATFSEKLICLWELLSEIEEILKIYRHPGSHLPKPDPKKGEVRLEFTRIRHMFGF